MGIETRRNGRRYLYRKERTPSGVRSVYLGPMSDPACVMLAENDRARRADAEADRARLGRVFDPIDAALGTLRQSAAELRTLARAYLVATGHRTHRGQWRRARHLRSTVAALPPLILPPMATKKKSADVSADTPAYSPGTSLGADTGTYLVLPADGVPRPGLADALRACQTDDPTSADVSRLRDELLTLPAESWGVPLSSSLALRSLAGIVTGSQTARLDTALVEASATRLASDLAGPDAGPLVRAAAAQAALSGLCLDAVTAGYGRVMTGAYRPTEGEHWERRMDAAQRRHLRALATLAALRRAESTEADRAAKMDRETPAPMDLHRFLPAPSGDSVPSPADLALSSA